MEFNINVYHHFPKDEDELTYQKKVLKQLSIHDQKLNLIMGQNEKVVAAIAELDAATNELASDLQALRDQVASGTVTDETLAALDAAIARAKVLGQDPENPVPPEG